MQEEDQIQKGTFAPKPSENNYLGTRPGSYRNSPGGFRAAVVVLSHHTIRTPIYLSRALLLRDDLRRFLAGAQVEGCSSSALLPGTRSALLLTSGSSKSGISAASGRRHEIDSAAKAEAIRRSYGGRKL